MIIDLQSLVLSKLPISIDVGLPATVALAAVALIGYLFGHRTRKGDVATLDAERQRELERATVIARQLETIAGSLRQDLANHHSQLAAFRRRLNQAQESDNDRAWQMVCSEAEAILAPTMQLAQQLSMAYDSIRQQSEALETFGQARTDPATGIANARALEQTLDILLASARRSGSEFSVAFLCLDRDVSSAAVADSNQTGLLTELAQLIQSCMRDSDFVARYGDEELVVVMHQTKLLGACIFADRLRNWVVERLSATISCGIAEYQMNDDRRSLLGRADSAFYSAKAAGGNCQFVHSGRHIREFRGSDSPPPADVVQSAAAGIMTPLAPTLVPAAGSDFGLATASTVDIGV
ncbi:MAG TPA: GGDEF domain-containing protein [Lacipirellulaceae bacterium]|jgi:diguanylate cyclase (GGDEF)-like protein